MSGEYTPRKVFTTQKPSFSLYFSSFGIKSYVTGLTAFIITLASEDATYLLAGVTDKLDTP